MISENEDDLPKGELCARRCTEAIRTRYAPELPSLAHRLAALPSEARAEVLGGLSVFEHVRLLDAWRFWARPAQIEPEGDWLIWLLMAGRGWGKSLTAAQWIKEQIENGAKSIGLCGMTLNDVWKDMVYGVPGAPGLVRLFDYLPYNLRPIVRRNSREITFPHTGTIVRIYTAEEPDKIRGPNNDAWWVDEIGTWANPQVAWDNIEMTARQPGVKPPRIVISATPRPLQFFKDLLDDPDVHVTFGSTFANAGNLAKTWIKRMIRRHAGTRLGLQELYGALLGDNPNALFKDENIDKARVKTAPVFERVVVSIDPGFSVNKQSDDTGIIVVGLLGEDAYPLADYTGKYSPREWGDMAVKALFLWDADCFICEKNNGGDLVPENVNVSMQRYNTDNGTKHVARIECVQASRGKFTRAEPIASLYEQGRVHHVGLLELLEKEMTDWNPRLTPMSPNRLDALVWAVHGLLIDTAPPDPAKTFEGLDKANAEGAAELDLDDFFNATGGMRNGGYSD